MYGTVLAKSGCDQDDATPGLPGWMGQQLKGKTTNLRAEGADSTFGLNLSSCSHPACRVADQSTKAPRAQQAMRMKVLPALIRVTILPTPNNTSSALQSGKTQPDLVFQGLSFGSA